MIGKLALNRHKMLIRVAMMEQTVRKFTSATKSATNNCRRLEGKVAVVTASTQGIGYSVARRFAQEGAKVVISSRKESNVKNAVEQLASKEGLEVSGIVCHVGKAEDRQKLLNEAVVRYGGLDILVPNAAANPEAGPVIECSESVWDKIFDINVKSTFLFIKESLPFLRKRQSASIIIMSSISGYQPLSLLGAYSVSKTTLLGLCKVVSEELASEGIRVNCIAPGVIKTKFSQPLYESKAAIDTTLTMIPMNRLGTPDEIGAVAAFLASDDAAYITGETIVAAGGMKSRL
ncbi:dehydrogenase/reductase SDR family member 4 [Copidosoma floridanum]|uniref:dehydrogenase/reductase SDR family member 4 n=1 Tax=Copidosoma floridanum TaxID=29053 RepID=UPI0006C9C9E0|nr:dehydrogenase/reductase SDR family member 4 [Copidosoma floridanum]XP_014210772.1 dehydrogenase/reductase SDR family member 4 [Copidosoma floridanum]